MADISPEWDKTIIAKDRLSFSPLYEEPSKESKNGVWQGRPIIGRDTRINGGVYVGAGEREAVVVDDLKQPELIEAYRTLLGRIQGRDTVLRSVFDLTKQLLPYNENTVEQITGGFEPDQKVGLSVFVRAKGGVCRHQALLSGYLLEKLKDDGVVRGTASIDRNYVPGEGGHAWVRYKNSAGEVYIIDPAQNYIGRIEDAGEGRWFYERPTGFIDKVKNIFRKKN